MTSPTIRRYLFLCAALSLISVASLVHGQSSTPATTVPMMIKFSGTVQGMPSRIIGMTFALYKESQGGPALWLETQSVSLDASGHYSVQLGTTLPNGLPKELFTSGEARWLGVQAEGQAEQPRVLLLSVPYALKAADAETVGGLPASAFVLATPTTSSTQTPTSAATVTVPSLAPPPGTVSGTGTANFVPLWTDSTDIGNSVVFQSGTGATAKIGVNTTTPAATLDVKGAGTIRGVFTLPSIGVATAIKGQNSQPIAMTASAFNSGTNAAVNQNFRWQAEAAGNNTASPSGTLNLLFGAGTSTPAETGLKISSAGRFTFATGQTFPGAGTISGVTAGTGLTGGGTTGSVTLNLDTTKVPELNVANTFVGNQTVTGNVSATGVVTGSSFQIGSNLFGYGSFASSNAFLGFGGSTIATGTSNTATGAQALSQNGTGSQNTAIGSSALLSNTSGSSNTAIGNGALNLNSTGSNNTAEGSVALQANTTGSYNTANGIFSLFNNTTGLFNTAVGYLSGPDSAHPNLSNSTAIGAMATVTASNAMVLGSISGVNGAGSNTNVGIGTTAPLFTLDVHGTGNFTGPITFASGQTFPNTISGVSAGTGLTGGGTTGNVTLNLDTTKIPQLNVANTFTGNQTVSGNLSATGLVTGSSFQIGSNLFAFGSFANSNAFLGFSGNTTTTGTSNTGNGYLALSSLTSGGSNTASGWEALTANTTGAANTATGVSSLFANTTGSNNVANGQLALFQNTTGGSNTASGSDALPHNTTGSNNTASGSTALYSSTSGNGNTAMGEGALFNNNTGSNNTAVGYLAGPADVFHANLSNATAIGANAEVDQSNTMVLGSINGLNGATADTLVGIGTTVPAAKLDVHGTANFTGLITFAPGQTFPGAGTITGITPGTALTGGGSSGSVTLNVDTTKVVTGITPGTDLTGGGTGGVQTLNLDTTKVPQLNAANSFTASQSVTGNVTATGTVTGGVVTATTSFNLGSNTFAFGSASGTNAFLGYAGNFTTTGTGNTASGWQALLSDTLGTWNTANGDEALKFNTAGNSNTAVGTSALQDNTTGTSNTAVGFGALVYTNGSFNTGLGYDAGEDSIFFNLTNSTAIGARSDVTESNALVLGSINGVNGATANTNVGIGTTAPLFPLHVERNDNSGAGIQVVAENQSTSGASFAVFNATSDNGVTAEMVADGIGTGPLHTPSGYFGTYTNQPIGLITANVERLHITATGQVGVGTSAPTHPFQVAQGLGAAFADSWTTYSSRRWKTNIQTLPNALAKVEQLRGVSYDLKGSGKHEIGVIAEEVGQVVPEVVSFEENGKDAQGVDYSRLTAVLIEAVKEQQRQIQDQRRQIHIQQRQIARLNGKVGVLETALRTPKRARASAAQVLSPAQRQTMETGSKFLAAK